MQVSARDCKGVRHQEVRRGLRPEGASPVE